MKYWDLSEWVIAILMIVVALLVIWLVALIPPSVSTQKVCNEYGWSEGLVQWNFDKYCRRIINQTEYICPLEDVLANSCVLDYESGN